MNTVSIISSILDEVLQVLSHCLSQNIILSKALTGLTKYLSFLTRIYDLFSISNEMLCIYNFSFTIRLYTIFMKSD